MTVGEEEVKDDRVTMDTKFCSSCKKSKPSDAFLHPTTCKERKTCAECIEKRSVASHDSRAGNEPDSRRSLRIRSTSGDAPTPPPSDDEADDEFDEAAHAAALAELEARLGVLVPRGPEAPRRPDGGVTLRDLLMEKYACAPENDFEASPAWTKAYMDWQDRLTEQDMPLAAFEGRRPRDAPPFGSSPFVGPVLPKEDDSSDDVMCSRFEEALRQWPGAAWWYTDRDVNFNLRPHRVCIREWFAIWTAANEGRGMRPWLPQANFVFDHMLTALRQFGHVATAAKLATYDRECQRLAEKTRARPADGHCEHCKKIAELVAAEKARGGATETAAPRATRVPLGDAPEPPITPDRRLCADHVKGVPILRCYPCLHCNGSATTSYDSSSDAKGQLTRTVSACYDVAADRKSVV